MKKTFLLAMLAGIFSINTAFAETIPYPKDLVIKPDEGAVSAPAEINHNDSMYFSENDFYNMTSTADRIILKNYPTYQQTTEYTCGPASALTVLYFFGEKHYDTSDHKQDGYVINNGRRFYAMWFDHSMLPQDQRKQSWIIARPKK